MYMIRSSEESDRQRITELLAENWGSNIVVSRGRVHDAQVLPGFVAEVDGVFAGVILYRVDGDECEIVLLESLKEGMGIGGGLIDAVTDVARARCCGRVWLVTTNDNTHAIRFYQRRGFSMAGIHLNAVAKSREIKPQIPLFGFDGIPIEHEIEFEKRLNRTLEC